MVNVILNSDVKKGIINKNIYGHFAEHLGRCIYEGIWVGENSKIPNIKGFRTDVIEALKKIKIPVLRWPGGCFADNYHWMDGIGPKENRACMVNTNWGGVTENNHFGTHEFMEFCELIGAEPYICGNLGSGTVQEMQQWVEYITFDGRSPMADLRKANGKEQPWQLKYFGVGNENWGCGGNMTAEYYANEYRRYATYVRNYSGNKIYKIAGGASVDDYHWTEVLMRDAAKHMDGLSVHYYTRVSQDWSKTGSANDFAEDEWFSVLKNAYYMEELVNKHSEIMDKYDPDKKVGLIVDEWGTWFRVEPGTNPSFLYQQNTMRDALVAGIHFNMFNNHCDRVQMANIAQMINVLQAVILTEGEKLLLTPTYHVFDMFKVHQDSQLLPVGFVSPDYICNGDRIPQLSISASENNEGKIHVSICNIDPTKEIEISIDTKGCEVKSVTGNILTAPQMNSMNTFENTEQVKISEFTSYHFNDNQIKCTIPSKSVVVIEIKK